MKIIPIKIFNMWCDDKQYHEISNDVSIRCYKKFVTLKDKRKFTALFAYDSINDKYYRVVRIRNDKYYGLMTEEEYQKFLKRSIELTNKRKYYDPVKVKY